MLAFIIIWGAAIAVGCVIGSNKGRTSEAILLSILLGWLGVLIIALLKPSRAAEVKKAADQLAIQHEVAKIAGMYHAGAPDCTRCGRPAAEHGPYGQCPTYSPT